MCGGGWGDARRKREREREREKERERGRYRYIKRERDQNNGSKKGRGPAEEQFVEWREGEGRDRPRVRPETRSLVVSEERARGRRCVCGGGQTGREKERERDIYMYVDIKREEEREGQKKGSKKGRGPAEEQFVERREGEGRDSPRVRPEAGQRRPLHRVPHLHAHVFLVVFRDVRLSFFYICTRVCPHLSACVGSPHLPVWFDGSTSPPHVRLSLLGGAAENRTPHLPETKSRSVCSLGSTERCTCHNQKAL